MQHGVTSRILAHTSSTAHLDPRRKNCLCTASNLGDAIGSLGYNSRRGYARRLLGLSGEKQTNRFMLLGQQHEGAVAETYQAITGNSVRLEDFALLEEDPRFGASPDYRVTTPEGETLLLEIKTTSKGDRLSHDIPVGHLLQMLGQCRVFGCDHCHYAVLHLPTKEYYFCDVWFKEELWRDVVYPRLKIFMDTIERKQTLDAPVSSKEKRALTASIRKLCFAIPFSCPAQ